MRQILILFLTFTLTLISCQQDKDSYTLEGEAVGFADGSKIFVYTFENEQAKAIDTLVVMEGRFSGTYPKSDDLRLNFLRAEEVNGTVIFFPENENLTAKIYKDSIQASRISGGAQNDAYGEFMSRMGEFNSQKQDQMKAFQEAQQLNDGAAMARIQSENLNLSNKETQYKKEFLARHDQSLFAVMLLAEMVSMEEIPPSEAKTYLQNLDPRIGNSEIAQELKSRLETMGKVEIGNKAPDFSAPDPDGKIVSLYETLGKYTIIDFWASWCKPCRVENPNVVRVYKKYHDKGLNIISVSLDKADQKDKWIQAIQDDEMDWYHISNLQFWNDPIARQYNIRSIPATFLLDEHGTIIDKNLRGAALEAKIGSLLGGE